MKTRLLAATLFAFTLGHLAAVEPAGPVHATTITRSSIKIGNGSFALTKGTKLEVVGREGDLLIVKFRTSQGKIPLAETDYDPATVLPEAATAAAPAKDLPKPAPAVVAPAKPAPAVAKPASAASATPPALNTSATGQQPATNYGKAVQKAKQAAEANKSTHVDPTKGIMDEESKK